MIKNIDDALDLLADLAEYMEKREDADFINDEFVPNEEMRLLIRIKELLGEN
jgi:hypothetical protein